MGTYIIKLQNTSGVNGTIIADAGFSYTDNLNEVNQGQLKVTGTGQVKRNLFEIGSQVWIYRNGSLEFHGIINALSNLNAGGISADLTGYEVWLGKENGDYAGSPWSSTASATIASAVIGESNYFTAGTVEAGTSLDFSLEPTSSLWNALSSLINRTAQDIGIDYSDSTVDILDHKGSSTSVMTLNDGLEIQDLTVRHAYPIGNDVRVYGKSEGETRIVSDHTSYGQDATSKSTYGTIRYIYNDSSVITQAEANVLADALVAQYKNPTKVYEFDVMNPNKSIVAGDVITLNSQTKGLSNEEVRVVGIERGIRNNKEFMTLEVTNKEYSKRKKSINSFIAELQKQANDINTYDQYGAEYSNQNIGTCIGGGSWFDDAIANLLGQGLLGNGVCGCTGDWTYLNGNLSVPAGVIQACLLNINTSSIYNRIDGDLYVTGFVCAACFCGPGAGGGDFWADVTGYLTPCNSCGLLLCNNVCAGVGGLCMGIAMSPGAFAEFHGECFIATNQFCGPVVRGTTAVCGGDVCATDDVIAGDFVCGASGYFSGNMTATSVSINGSSACQLYVSGNGYVTGQVYGGTVCGGTCVDSNIVCGDCTYACRRLKLPVGTNCY
jgi:hypothetical protein